ncbi:helix-turn-helix domain-containing protein [Methanobrevibacter sp.]|uniref:helix-turn-helix domain-containing protein n=1 Tax=Methanobrevibacter sp. TaxID=66852 RepID=UPI0038701750
MTTVGAILKKLREENGYSQRQIAEYLEIDQSNLSKIENNKRKLNWTLSEKILSLYNCTPEYLLGKEDSYEKREIAFKSGKNMDLNVISRINILAKDLSILRKFNDDYHEIEMPKPSSNLKRKWGLDEYCPINVFNLLQIKIPNLTISWFPMKMNVSGCCFKEGIDSIILLNSSHSRGRQNFTLAHELYHLLDDDENFFICSEDFNEDVEIRADNFASTFLLSPLALEDFIESNNINEWTIADIVKCEQYFQLDHRQFIGRLHKEGLIDGNQFAEFSFKIIEKSASLGYGTSLYEPTINDSSHYSIGHMIPLTEKLFTEKKLTGGVRRDILNDLFRQDLLYKTLRDSNEE